MLVDFIKNSGVFVVMVTQVVVHVVSVLQQQIAFMGVIKATVRVIVVATTEVQIRIILDYHVTLVHGIVIRIVKEIKQDDVFIEVVGRIIV